MGRVISQSELILQRREWKRNGERVVFVSGVFDLLHPGHIRLLEQARSYGEILIAAIPSDESVRSTASATTNGVERPITPAAERAEILAALEAVDFVTEFDDATPLTLLLKLVPEVQVKGGPAGRDSTARQEEAAAAAAGIQSVHVPLEPGYSTTRLLERIQQLRA